MVLRVDGCHRLFGFTSTLLLLSCVAVNARLLLGAFRPRFATPRLCRFPTVIAPSVKMIAAALDITISYQHHFLSDAALHTKSLLPGETCKRIMRQNESAKKANHDVSKEWCWCLLRQVLRSFVNRSWTSPFHNLPHSLSEFPLTALFSRYENCHQFANAPDFERNYGSGEESLRGILNRT